MLLGVSCFFILLLISCFLNLQQLPLLVLPNWSFTTLNYDNLWQNCVNIKLCTYTTTILVMEHVDTYDIQGTYSSKDEMCLCISFNLSIRGTRPCVDLETAHGSEWQKSVTNQFPNSHWPKRIQWIWFTKNNFENSMYVFKDPLIWNYCSSFDEVNLRFKKWF